MVSSICNIITLCILFNFCFSENKSLNVITTNDMHGFINEQKAYFINPVAHQAGGSWELEESDEFKLAGQWAE